MSLAYDVAGGPVAEPLRPGKRSDAAPLAPPSKCLRFGLFEADLSAGELTKNGKRVRLQEQPFQLLATLLGRPGELVTRQELQAVLWPDTTVDYDHGLNKAVSKVREALGNSAENARFVETVASRGYRFLARVAAVSDASDLHNGATDAASPRSGVNVSSNVAHRPLKYALGFALAVLTAGGIAWLCYPSQHAALKVRSLAVLPLQNMSNDPAQDFFADGMTDELITHLGQIGSLRVISRSSAMTYKNVHKPLAAIARELNVDAVVEGSVLRAGDRVRIIGAADSDAGRQECLGREL